MWSAPRCGPWSVSGNQHPPVPHFAMWPSSGQWHPRSAVEKRVVLQHEAKTKRGTKCSRYPQVRTPQTPTRTHLDEISPHMLGLVSQKYCFLPPNAFLIDLLTKLSSLPFWNVSRIYFFLSTHSNLHHFSPNNLNILISLPAPSLIPESSIPYGPTRVIVLKHRPCPLLKNFPQRPITEREKSKIALMIWPQSVVFQSHLLPYFLCPLYCSLPNSFLDTLCVLTSQPLSSVWNNLWDPYLSLRTQPKCVPLREGLHSHP